ncbi:MAG: hypothetical protein AB1393_14640, partial [Candidatus Edwardsbacteria bacterium]
EKGGETMTNNNGNSVSIKMRQKAEEILIAKCNRIITQINDKKTEIMKKAEKQMIAELALDNEFSKIKEMKKQMQELEREIKKKTGYEYSGYGRADTHLSELEESCTHGYMFQKELEKRTKAEYDFDTEKARIEELKDKLIEELWLAGQPEEVSKILSKMK